MEKSPFRVQIVPKYPWAKEGGNLKLKLKILVTVYIISTTSIWKFTTMAVGLWIFFCISDSKYIHALRTRNGVKQWVIEARMRRRDGIFPSWVAKPRMRENKIPHESRKACLNSPCHGLAGVVKKIPSRAAEPRVVEFFLPQLLNHKWGIETGLEWGMGNFTHPFFLSLLQWHSG